MNQTDKIQYFTEAMQFRHACKLFSEQKIPQDEFEAILEIGRLSPSSFGMEPWRLIVVQSKSIREKIKPACWNQNQISDCSHLLVIAADTKVVRGASDYVKNMFSRRNLPEDATNIYIKKYQNYLAPFEAQKELLQSWTARQCYILLANMMTFAATLGVDSCPMEGFDKSKLEYLLNMPSHHSVAVLLALGYRAGEQPSKKRLSTNDIIQIV